MVREHFALSYRVRTKQLWSRSIFGLLMDLFPFSIGAGLADPFRLIFIINLNAESPFELLSCFYFYSALDLSLHSSL